MLITEVDKVRHEQKGTSALIPKAAPADKQVLAEKGRAMRNGSRRVPLAALKNTGKRSPSPVAFVG